ncbi:hypothetical protein [Nostoc sp.]
MASKSDRKDRNSPQLQSRLTSILDEIELKQQQRQAKLSIFDSHHHNRVKV